VTEALFEAIAAHDREAVAAILSRDPEAARARNRAGVSAVLWALYNSEPELARGLAAAGPLDVFEAAALDRVDRVRELVSADPGLLGAQTPDGYHALGLAAFFAASGAVRVLLDAGADPNQAAANPMKVTALHAAAGARRADLVRMLLEAGADPDARQHQGWTALHQARHSGDDAMARLLLDAGADPHARTDDGLTPDDVRPAATR
jgi:ankyrin repeat protein